MTARPHQSGQSIANLIAQTSALITFAVGFLALAGWALGRPILASWQQGRIPMAPDTALLFLLLGTAVFCNARTPANHPVRLAGLAVGSAVALLALVLFVLSIQGIFPDVEHLGFNIAEAEGSVRSGHMSPATAVCFQIGGLSLVGLLYATPDRRWPATVALLLSGVLQIASIIFLFAYFSGVPLLYATPFLPPALPTSLALATLGAALFSLAWSQAWRIDNDPALDTVSQQKPLTLIPIFCSL